MVLYVPVAQHRLHFGRAPRARQPLRRPCRCRCGHRRRRASGPACRGPSRAARPRSPGRRARPAERGSTATSRTRMGSAPRASRGRSAPGSASSGDGREMAQRVSGARGASSREWVVLRHRRGKCARLGHFANANASSGGGCEVAAASRQQKLRRYFALRGRRAPKYLRSSLRAAAGVTPMHFTQFRPRSTCSS